jgi:hypothetical protein
MTSVVQGMEENITTMNESLRNESTKLDDLMNLNKMCKVFLKDTQNKF